MQELNVQSSNPTPYTPAGGAYNMNPTPGAGGLPALSGLNNRMNPMAQELQQQGRGQDSMLVHMTPDEVNDLQGLALYSGTTMTINPNTGLPEAGLLGKVFKKLLPTLLGAGLAATGVGAPLAAGIVGLGSTALTGSLKKGLMAGLGAYGGASLAGAAGLGGSISKTGFGTLGSKAGIFGANMGAGTGASLFSGAAGATGATVGSNLPSYGTLVTGVPGSAAGTAAGAAAKTGLAGVAQNFGKAASAGLPGILGKAAPMVAASGLVGGISGAADAAKKKGKGPEEEKTWAYEGPYLPQERVYDPQTTGFEGEGETMFFRNPNPFPGYRTATGGVPTELQTQFPRGFADGGEAQKMSVPMTDVSKMRHEDLISKGYEGSQLAAGAAPGSVSSLGGQTFIVNPQGRWEAYTPAPTPAPAAPAPAPTSGRLTLTGLPPVIPMTDTTKTTVTDTSTPTRNTETAKTTTTVANPQAGQSGYGVKALPNMYVPQYTSKDDFVTEKAAPYELGGQLARAMPQFVDMYRTSPGAVTSSLQYPGGSFNEQFKAQLAARPKAPTPLDTFLTEYYARYGAPPADYSDIPPSFTSYAKGGVHMDDGAFVVDARTVSELGNGSSSAGQELLARLGGRPVKGPGDGVSDSIPAKIGGTQEARVARDEVIFPAKDVKKLGGAKKLYALMDKAHKARKKAERGSDTKLRKGLGAL